MSFFTFLQANPAVFVVVMGVLGLIVGSFLNVVIHRLPIMMEREWREQCAELCGTPQPPEQRRFNLWQPRSHCPYCGHGIAVTENIPVLSYLLQRGRCTACRAAISRRYPVVEMLGGSVAATAAWTFGLSAAAAGAAVLGWALIALSFIDYDHHLLPDPVTLPLLWLGIAFNLFGTFAALNASIIGAMAGYLSLWIVYWLFKLLTHREGMGYGDFKLLAALGAWSGWQMLPATIILSSAAGAVLGVGLIVLGGRDRHKPIPFGPFLAGAGWVALLWGANINAAYLRWSAPF